MVEVYQPHHVLTGKEGADREESYSDGYQLSAKFFSREEFVKILGSLFEASDDNGTLHQLTDYHWLLLYESLKVYTGVRNPDYDFLDPRLSEFYEGLRNKVSLDGWIHGLEAVTQHLGCAWHEVAIMERLFPSLPGMRTYQEELWRITKGSNDLLLNVVKDLSYVYSDGRESRWDPAAIENSRKQVLEDLLAARDAFVFRH